MVVTCDLCECKSRRRERREKREERRERGVSVASNSRFLIDSDDVDQLQLLAESRQCEVAARGGVETSIFVAAEAARAAEACCRRLSVCCGVGRAPRDPLRGCVRGLADSSGLLISQISVWRVGNLGFGFDLEYGKRRKMKSLNFFWCYSF